MRNMIQELCRAHLSDMCVKQGSCDKLLTCLSMAAELSFASGALHELWQQMVQLVQLRLMHVLHVSIQHASTSCRICCMPLCLCRVLYGSLHTATHVLPRATATHHSRWRHRACLTQVECSACAHRANQNNPAMHFGKGTATEAKAKPLC